MASAVRICLCASGIHFSMVFMTFASIITESLKYSHQCTTLCQIADMSFMESMNLYSLEWNDHKYNFLDTPGYFDFDGEVVSAMAAASGTIIVVDGTTDLQVGTDKALEITDDYQTPRFIFVNKIDSEKSDYDKILEQLREQFIRFITLILSIF